MGPAGTRRAHRARAHTLGLGAYASRTLREVPPGPYPHRTRLARIIFLIVMMKPDHIVIYLSGRCNLACPYCYARGVSKKTISAAALRSALSDFAAAKPGHPKFTILGGEPLLCRVRLDQAIALIRKHFGPGAPVHLFTNGLAFRKDEAKKLLERGVRITVSLDGRPGAGRPADIPNLPRALRKDVSVSAVVSPGNAGELLPNMIYLLGLGFERLAWSPDITAAWDAAALRHLRTSSKALLLEYLRRLKSGRGVWELANGYEAVALAARAEKPGPCRNLALAPDGAFYPCDKMLSGTEKQLRPFRVDADGGGRKKFFSLASACGFSSAQSMCPLAPWAAARFSTKSGPVPRGQAEARKLAALWLRAAVKAGLSSPAFRRLHGI